MMKLFKYLSIFSISLMVQNTAWAKKREKVEEEKIEFRVKDGRLDMHIESEEESIHVQVESLETLIKLIEENAGTSEDILSNIEVEGKVEGDEIEIFVSPSK